MSVGPFFGNPVWSLLFSIDEVDADEYFPSPLVEGLAAPRPVPRVFDEPAFQRVRKRVAEPPDFPSAAPNVEIVEPPLPELGEPPVWGANSKDPCAAGAPRHDPPLSRRETRCFSISSTVEGVARAGLEMSS